MVGPGSGEESFLVPPVDVSTLSEEDQKTLEAIQDNAGYLPNSARLWMHRPDIARAAMGWSRAIRVSPDSTLPLELKAKLGIICSSVNNCRYCTSHQCGFAAHDAQSAVWAAGLSEAQMVALIDGSDKGDTPLEEACFEFARIASFDPQGVSAELVERTLQHLRPPQLVELAAVIAHWKFYNTAHDILHVPLEGLLNRYSDIIEQTNPIRV
jgi:alkylhydroperoxidase family enzyme